MNRRNRLSTWLTLIVFVTMIFACDTPALRPEEPGGKQEYPGEWMYRQRAFPFDHVNRDVYRAAVVQARAAHAVRSSGSAWTSVGPVNIGGRITDIALHPENPDIIYAGSANGGVFKSEDGGQTWTHIYLNAGSLSIGNLEIAPSDPDIIYVGTGEANGGYSMAAFAGDGMHRSDNGGETWQSIGLPESQHIGRIVVHPKDADIVYVAATGYMYGKNNDRGIYKTTNGGQDWEQVLFVSDSTSAIDVVIHPLHPDTVFAAFWERQRYPDVRDYAGISSGIHRSTNGGETWEHLTEGLPVHDEVGRIGLAIAPSAPDTIYASYAFNEITNDFAGIFRSIDAGTSWERIDDGLMENEQVNAGFGWYFGNLRVHPLNPDLVFHLGLNLWMSPNAGSNWTQLTFGDVHVDHHALEMHPQNPQLLVLGTDGGIYISRDEGFIWTHVETLPITEFYTCEMDESAPYKYYGGAQDNGTMRTRTGNHNDWEPIFGGDGFHVLVDPTDSNVIYVEYQWGNLFKSIDGGFNWDYALLGVNGLDRVNWNTPYILSPHNPQRLYFGTHRLYTSDNGASFWEVMSDDLTNTDPASPGGEAFGALSTIAVAPSDSNVIYTGSEDGAVFATFDHGEEWQDITGVLPERYVTRVVVDPYDALTVYVTMSGYRELDYMSHIYRSTNGGQSWVDISGNLPEVPLNDLIIDPEIEGALYAASDLGVWTSPDGGSFWQPLGEGLPLTAYTDLDFHAETRTLLAASYGLSMWKYDLGEPVSSVIDFRVLNEFTVTPNPFGDEMVVAFQLERNADVEIAVHDLEGRISGKVLDENLHAGDHLVQWQNALTPGMYVISCRAGVHLESQLVVRH